MATIKDLSELNRLDIELKQNLESHKHADEFTADTRLFVWNFNPDDAKKFVDIFKRFNARLDNNVARNILDGELQRQCKLMLADVCNPIECMLYTSKVSNSRFDDALVLLLAERIKAVCDERFDESAEVLEHIFQFWTWTPQLRAAITAVGLIGDDDQLLDLIYPMSANAELKKDVFRAFMYHKSSANLERAMDIVINLRGNVEIDREIANIFVREFSGFAPDGINVLKEYLDGNHVISRHGFAVLHKIARNIGLDVDGNYSDNLANRSFDDDDAYAEFVKLCREQPNDENFAFRARFSRREIIDDVLEPLLRSEETVPIIKHYALISTVHLARRRGKDLIPRAIQLVAELQKDDANQYACLVASMLLNDRKAIGNFVLTLAQVPSDKLQDLYHLLNNASLIKADDVLPNIRRALYDQIVYTFRNGYYVEMENLASNLQIFKFRNLAEFVSKDSLNEIKRLLKDYSQDTRLLSDKAAIDLINVGVRFDRNDFIRVLFMLYEQRMNVSIKGYARKMLLQTETLDPKARARIK